MNSMFRTELKGVVKLAIAEAGGQENCANVSGRIRRHSAFSEYANIDVAERVMPIDVAVEIDAFNNNARIVSAMARQLGHVVVKAPAAALATCDVTALCRLATESAEAVAEFGRARADGVLTAIEARAVRRQLHDLVVVALELDGRLALVDGREGD